MEISLKTAVLGAGWSLLDAYLTLNRKSLTSEELVIASKTLMTANYAYLIQHYYKQKLLNNSMKRTPKEIKPHLSGHLIHFYERDGSCLIYDSWAIETGHKRFFKNIARHSSGRLGGEGLVVELYNRMNRGKLLKRAKMEYERFYNLTPIQRIRNRIIDPHVISVETEAGVVYECSTFQSDRDELVYNENSTNWFVKCVGHYSDFLNPICRVNHIIEQCEKEDNLKACLIAIKNKEAGIMSYFYYNVRSIIFNVYYIVQ